MAAFITLAVVGTYPLIRNFATDVPAGGDTWRSYWNLYWVKRAVLDLHVNPFFTPELYFPYGASLYYHTLNFFQSALALPVAGGLGLAAAYNCFVLLSFVLTGYATYRLARYVLETDVTAAEDESHPVAITCAAFLAGVIFTFSSYRYVHVFGHLDLISTQWLPFYVLFLLKTGRESGWRNPLVAGLFLTAAALTTSYYLLFLIAFSGLLVAWTMVTRPSRWPSAIARFAATGLFAGLLLSPVLWPMSQLGSDAGRTPDPAYDIDRFSGDLASFAIPSPLPRWSQGLAARARPLVARPGTSTEGLLFLGVLPVLLAVFGLTRRSARGFWLVGFLTFSALALGPVLYVAGRPVPLFSKLMPYRLLLQLPFGDVPRVPARFVVMAVMFLAVLAAIGAWRLFRNRPRWASALGASVFGTLIIAEHAALPLSLSAADVPKYYTQLAQSPDRGALLEAPIPDDPSRFPVRMLYQTVHQRPVYGGYLARGLPPLPFPAIPGFGQFVSLSPTIDDVVPYSEATFDAISRTVLNAYTASHLVIDRDILNASQVESVRAVADRLLGPGSRVFEDLHTLGYVIPKESGPTNTAVWLDTGWSYLERDSALAPDGRTMRWRWMSQRARLGVMSPSPQQIRMKIRALSFGRPRRVQLLVNGDPLGVLTIGTDLSDYGTQAIQIAGGITFIELVSLDGTNSPGPDRRHLSVALHRAEVLTER